MTPIRPSQTNMAEQRRRRIERTDDMSVKDTASSGRTLFQGLGEVLYDLKFPVGFSTRPIFTYGAELDDGYSPVGNEFPYINAVIVAWDVKNRVDGAFDGYFVGCTIAITVGGSVDQQTWLHWSFRGAAIRNPVILSGQTDDVL